MSMNKSSYAPILAVTALSINRRSFGLEVKIALSEGGAEARLQSE
jgi:hypothetical protein